MSKIGIIYHSKTGNTEKMASHVLKGVNDIGTEVDGVLKPVENTETEDLLDWQGIIVGSPTYYGLPSAPIKKLFDRSVEYHGELDGKIGGAFSSAANRAGGNETTIIAIIEMMLIHGMIVQGTPENDHYGPVAIGEPDERALKGSEKLGSRVARLVLDVKS